MVVSMLYNIEHMFDFVKREFTCSTPIPLAGKDLDILEHMCYFNTQRLILQVSERRKQ
jgi:hypothetical protein